MSFWNPWTQKDAPHEGPYHPVWAPPRWLRHAPSPAGVGAQGLPRIIPPASLSCARTLHPMPSPCLSPRPPLPPFPQPHPSLPASSSSQSRDYPSSLHPSPNLPSIISPSIHPSSLYPFIIHPSTIHPSSLQLSGEASSEDLALHPQTRQVSKHGLELRCQCRSPRPHVAIEHWECGSCDPGSEHFQLYLILMNLHVTLKIETGEPGWRSR